MLSEFGLPNFKCWRTLIMSDHTATVSPPDAPAAGQTNRNGVTETSAQPVAAAAPTSNSVPAASGDQASATSKADQMVDNLALKIAVTTSAIGRGLLRLVARTREELSDIWAEAQGVRRGEK
jgi:hypothetical protein